MSDCREIKAASKTSVPETLQLSVHRAEMLCWCFQFSA